MNSKVICAVLFLGLLYTSCFVEAGHHWHAVRESLKTGTAGKLLSASILLGNGRPGVLNTGAKVMAAHNLLGKKHRGEGDNTLEKIVVGKAVLGTLFGRRRRF